MKLTALLRTPRLQSETFDMVLTDPPYLVSHSGRWGSDWVVIEGDSDTECDWVEPVYSELSRVQKPDSPCSHFMAGLRRKYSCAPGNAPVSVRSAISY